MLWLLLGLHAAAVVGVLALGSGRASRTFILAGAPSAVTAACALVWVSDGRTRTAEVDWVAGLDLTLAFRVDDLAALMTLIVSGIGVLIFWYASGYSRSDDPNVPRLAATLTAFSASMLGLVWAETIWALFICWELTSITSFLLVGHRRDDPAVLLAARRALVITVSGGLALLAGAVVLVDSTGTARLTDMGQPAGVAAAVAGVLIVLAAATKSAQVPFHVWLPGAMAAPTPVSAYLHSATMVKAGVVLMAITTPILGANSWWSTGGLVVGIASMLWGAIGALRQLDAKLILAWGTISQLGLMITLLSAGSGKATFAAISIVLAHAVFKAALFMVVGEVDVRAGTRVLTELGGLRDSMPIAFIVAVAAGASMAGVPPLIGFTAKEAAIEAALGLDGVQGLIVLVSVVGGAVLTVAYTVRLLIGLFGPGPQRTVSPTRWAMAGPACVLAAISLAGFVLIGLANDLVIPAATEIDPASAVYELKRWPGLTTGLVVSLAVVAAGALLGHRLARGLARSAPPAARGAALSDQAIDGAAMLARRLTVRVQHGSLPVYVATMAGTVSLAALPFVAGIELDRLFLWDSRLEPALAVAAILASIGSVLLSSRLAAALGLGAVGLVVSAVFLVEGAPDLALTQLLVETVVVVGFVLGLGNLKRRFPASAATWRGVRIAISLMVGAAVAVGLAASAADPSGRPPVEELTREAVAEGGGNNTVNVVLTDIRALDTMGEIVVLAVVAIGILAIGRSAKRSSAPRRESLP